MPDAIWSGLIGALVSLGGALAVHFWFVRPQHEKELKLAKKKGRREKKPRDERALAQPPGLLERSCSVDLVAREADAIASALSESDDALVELTRDTQTHDAWLRLARVSRELPKHVRRTLLNTLRQRGQEKEDVYAALCEYLQLPKVELADKEHWDELSSEKRRSLVIHHAIHTTHEDLVSDLLQLGMLSASALVVQSELTDYMITDEEVDAYVLDWVRQQTSADFVERALEAPKDSSLVEAAELERGQRRPKSASSAA